jgi:hypothetical protein
MRGTLDVSIAPLCALGVFRGDIAVCYEEVAHKPMFKASEKKLSSKVLRVDHPEENGRDVGGSPLVMLELGSGTSVDHGERKGKTST